MTLLETVAAFTAPLATWAALVSMIRCKRAVSDARKALIVAERALNETANLNAPLVLFQCEMRQQNIYAEVLVTIFNSGNQPTDITSGRITLMQGNYANVERARELQAISLPGRREHFEEFRILKGMETGEAQHDNVEIACEATYTRDGQPDGHAYEKFVFDTSLQRFVRQRQ